MLIWIRIRIFERFAVIWCCSVHETCMRKVGFQAFCDDLYAMLGFSQLQMKLVLQVRAHLELMDNIENYH
jgi:hypothetical protein